METIIETQGLTKSYRWKEAVHQLDIRVTLQDGTIHEHLIHSSEICGRTELGQVQIAIPDVREIVNVTEPKRR